MLSTFDSRHVQSAKTASAQNLTDIDGKYCFHVNILKSVLFSEILIFGGKTEGICGPMVRQVSRKDKKV